MYIHIHFCIVLFCSGIPFGYARKALQYKHENIAMIYQYNKIVNNEGGLGWVVRALILLGRSLLETMLSSLTTGVSVTPHANRSSSPFHHSGPPISCGFVSVSASVPCFSLFIFSISLEHVYILGNLVVRSVLRLPAYNRERFS